MHDEYGLNKTFGNTEYGVQGMHSREAAIENVHRRAFENGDWKPRNLREKWWQFWRPIEHTEIEKKFTHK